VDINARDKLPSLKEIAASKKTILRCKGTEQHQDRTITKKEKQCLDASLLIFLPSASLDIFLIFYRYGLDLCIVTQVEASHVRTYPTSYPG